MRVLICSYSKLCPTLIQTMYLHQCRQRYTVPQTFYVSVFRMVKGRPHDHYEHAGGVTVDSSARPTGRRPLLAHSPRNALAIETTSSTIYRTVHFITHFYLIYFVPYFYLLLYFYSDRFIWCFVLPMVRVFITFLRSRSYLFFISHTLWFVHSIRFRIARSSRRYIGING